LKLIRKIIDLLDFFPVIAQTLEHFTKLTKHAYTRSSWCNFFVVFHLQLWFCRSHCYCSNVSGF